MNIYDVRRYGKLIFLVVAAAVVGIFLNVSSNIVKDLSIQERERMEIWADATRQVANISMSGDEQPVENSENLDFLLSIIQGNHSIPVILTDGGDNIIGNRNFDLPDPVDSLNPLALSQANIDFLREKLDGLKGSNNVIEIAIPDASSQYLYYEDSRLLKRLSLFPYLQLLVMVAFVAIVYFAVVTTKRAEQNKVWVGLSKETAHQLGTPISSLMAWMELLESLGVEPETVSEMNKDVTRLSTIASRFSKIGSKPAMERVDINAVITSAVSYMSTRISSRIKLTTDLTHHPLEANISSALIEWVLENLIKNAVDAMEGSGEIDIETSYDSGDAIIDITDTGKGIARKRKKTIFNPGYTTKERGWGLGLTLARRIIEQYHNGRIFVLHSEPGRGTTFRITIPLARIPDPEGFA